MGKQSISRYGRENLMEEYPNISLDMLIKALNEM